MIYFISIFTLLCSINLQIFASESLQQMLASDAEKQLAAREKTKLHNYRDNKTFRLFFIDAIEAKRSHMTRQGDNDRLWQILASAQITEEDKILECVKALTPSFAYQEFKNILTPKQLDMFDDMSDQNNLQTLCKIYPQAFQRAQNLFEQDQEKKFPK